MSPALVPFTAHRMKGARSLWLNRAALREIGEERLDEERFVSRFAYGVRDTMMFSHVEFDEQDEQGLFAERYGGLGVGQHGGGARVGNLGRFQIKGLGRNPLAGRSDGSMGQEAHGFGGLCMVDAIGEAINSELCHRVLPLGATRCYGLLESGPKTAYYPQRTDAERSAGALLVREISLRPGHFIRAMQFSDAPAAILSMGTDVTRTREMCRSLRAFVGGDREFVAYVGKFLAACANQFAFARLWRLNHGSISPSNIGADGRWLDLMGTSFLEPGMNYAPAPHVIPFLDEAGAIKNIATEWVLSFSKFCHARLNPAPLCDYYDRAFEDALTAHIPAFFGLPRPGPDPGAACALLELRRAVSAAVTTGLQLTDRLPYPRPVRDPALELAESLFRSLRMPAAAPSELSSCFRKVVDAAFATPRGKTMPRWFFEARAAMTCLKRLHFALVFGRGQLIGEGSAAVLSGDPMAIGRMIDEWVARLDWVFPADRSPDSITLFQSGGVKLSLRSDRHVELRQGPAVRRFHAADGMSELRTALDGLDGTELTLPGHYGYPAIPAFSFRRGIDSMLNMAALLASEEQACV